MLQDRLSIIDKELSECCEWNEHQKELLREKAAVEETVLRFDRFNNAAMECRDLYALAVEDNDNDVLSDLSDEIDQLSRELQGYKIECLQNGEADTNSCFIALHAGAGGTEAQDWVQMLMRMYCRWCERKKYSIEILEQSDGEEAGLKSVSLKIEGYRAYGWLKMESGVHRLVRISPFDSNARRHTSFASVLVYPVVSDAIDITIEEKDLRVDTYRASGAGGQHVNKTDSAIRITHIPSGIVVQCQNDRSQHRNRATAMNMLRARLYQMELEKREKERNEGVEKREIGWGSQIRSYVLQPYQMVKDLRTGYEKGNAAAVLDGDIDEFLYAALSASSKANSV